MSTRMHRCAAKSRGRYDEKEKSEEGQLYTSNEHNVNAFVDAHGACTHAIASTKEEYGCMTQGTINK
jgi:hypothetical protein